MTEVIPAATVVIVRDNPHGHEVLMVERHTQLAFAGGAAVFPGGRVDEDDRRIAADARFHERGVPGDIDDAAARVAAVRESLEESGIAIGIPALAIEHWAELRHALNSGAPFSELLLSGGFKLDTLNLTPFARWQPTFETKRIFDTRFYLAKAPTRMPSAAEADGDETTRIFWIRPQDMLDQAERGEAHIIFPTRRNLERLAQYGSYSALETHARSISVTKISPEIREIDGQKWVTIPEGLGYPVLREALESVKRG